RGGPARFDGMHQPELMERQAMLLAVPGPVGAEDVGHLEGGPGHGGLTGGGFLQFSLPADRSEGLTRPAFCDRGVFAAVISSGLTMLETVRGETAVYRAVVSIRLWPRST